MNDPPQSKCPTSTVNLHDTSAPPTCAMYDDYNNFGYAGGKVTVDWEETKGCYVSDALDNPRGIKTSTSKGTKE